MSNPANETPPDPEPVFRPLDDYAIASACYEAERKVYAALGRWGMPPWESVPEGERRRRTIEVETYRHLQKTPLAPENETELAKRIRRMHWALFWELESIPNVPAAVPEPTSEAVTKVEVPSGPAST